MHLGNRVPVHVCGPWLLHSVPQNPVNFNSEFESILGSCLPLEGSGPPQNLVTMIPQIVLLTVPHGFSPGFGHDATLRLLPSIRCSPPPESHGTPAQAELYQPVITCSVDPHSKGETKGWGTF